MTLELCSLAEEVPVLHPNMDPLIFRDGKKRDMSWFTPVWLYDEIMQHIEPDLLSKNLPFLDDKYKGETEAEHADRMASYDTSFEIFDRAFEGFQSEFIGEVKTVKKEVRNKAQAQAKAEDEQVLKTIEKDFDATND